MKQMLFCFALLLSGSVIASTDHYILRDGNHVHHLKIKKLMDEERVNEFILFTSPKYKS